MPAFSLNRRLQLATERYEKEQTVRQVQSLRLDASQKSTLKDMLAGRLERHVSADGIEMENRLRHHSVTVGLEQIVHFGMYSVILFTHMYCTLTVAVFQSIMMPTGSPIQVQRILREGIR